MYIADILTEIGLDVRVTRHGNMIARWEGQQDIPGLVAGSHLDTVPRGGNYDGVVGVVGAIEAVRVLRETGFVPVRPIDVIIFAEEEGSSFGHLLAGSQALVGKIDSNRLRQLTNGEGFNYLECAEQYQKHFLPADTDQKA